MTAESGEISGLSGRVMAVSLVVGACAIAILTVNWDRGRTKVGAFYDIAPRLGGLAPVGHADKGNTDHYRVAFKGPEIFAARRMTSKGGPLPLFDNRDRWAWFLSPDQVCLDCSGAVIYGALMTYSEGEVIRVDFRDIDGDTVQHYTVARQGEVYQLDHSQPSPRRGVEREEHTYDSFDRISEVKFEGGDVRYVRDEKGRVIEEITRGPQASRVKFTYGEERHPARPSDRVNAGPDVHGCTIEHTDWDSIGHPVLIQCLNELRQPVVSTMGCASFEIFWDNDNWTTACLDINGKPTKSNDGWVHLRVKTDPMAFPQIIAFLDAEGHEVATPSGASKARIGRDERGIVVDYTRYAPDGQTL